MLQPELQIGHVRCHRLWAEKEMGKIVEVVFAMDG
jgi:hypothetical protein